MSLDNLKLSPFLVKELYENSLIDDTANAINKDTKSLFAEKKTSQRNNTEETPANTENSIKYLGNNKKNILIAVDEEAHAFLGDDDLKFLIAILNACSISVEDTAIVNRSNNENVIYKKLTDQFNPAIVLFIGTEPQLLGFPIQIPHYRVQKYNKQQYVCAPALHILSSDKEAKKQLWTALKELFAIG